MAKLENATPFDSMRCKYAKTDQIYFKNRKKDNATIGVRMKHPAVPESTNQKRAQADFTTVQEAVKTIMADSTQLAPYKKAYDNQRKFTSLRGYIFHCIYDSTLAEAED